MINMTSYVTWYRCHLEKNLKTLPLYISKTTPWKKMKHGSIETWLMYSPWGIRYGYDVTMPSL